MEELEKPGTLYLKCASPKLNENLISPAPSVQIYKGQLKIFGYQKLIFIQQMDILCHQHIFHQFFYFISAPLETLEKNLCDEFFHF